MVMGVRGARGQADGRVHVWAAAAYLAPEASQARAGALVAVGKALGSCAQDTVGNYTAFYN